MRVGLSLAMAALLLMKEWHLEWIRAARAAFIEWLRAAIT